MVPKDYFKVLRVLLVNPPKTYVLVTHFLTQVDEFTGKLWEIYETIKSEGGPVQVKMCW